jgi:hypothetical protein
MRTRIKPGIVGAAGFPWSPQFDIDSLGGLWFDANDLTTGAVSSWPDRGGLGFAPVQGTVSAKPTKGATGLVFDGGDALALNTSASKVKFIRRATVPDGVGMPSGTTGKGVTCTGLCRIPGTTQFWMGNHGDTSAGKDGSGPFLPSLIRFDYTGGVITKLQEIAIAPLIANVGSIQGVTYDTSDDTLWFAVATGSAANVYHITQSGTLLNDTITASWLPNGVAYIPSEDAIWIAENPTAGGNIEKRSCATGAVTVAAVSSGASNQDMLHYDASTGCLILSFGANASPGGLKIFATSGTNGALVNVGQIILDSHADCIEGIVWENGKLYSVNDSFYHDGTDLLNQLVEHSIVPVMSNKISVHLTALVTATTSSDCFIEVGLGTDGPVDGSGFGVYPASTTTLSVFTNTFSSGTTQRGSIIAATVPAMTSFRLIDIYFDVPNDLVTMYVDGTLVTTGSLAALIGGISTAGQITIGSSLNSRLITGTIKDIIICTGQSNRQRMEGYRANRWSLTGNLPANHPYKNVAP